MKEGCGPALEESRWGRCVALPWDLVFPWLGPQLPLLPPIFCHSLAGFAHTRPLWNHPTALNGPH